MTTLTRMFLLFCAAAVLQGCALAAGASYLVYEQEVERLEAQRVWEEGLQSLDCAGLAAAQTELQDQRDELFDFDQRQSTLKTEIAEKGCS